MTDQMKAKIAAMQTKRTDRPEIQQNPNGTWSHHKCQTEFADRATCALDLRWTNDWEAVA